MEQAMKLGTNKTGIDMSPIHTKEMLEAVENTPVFPADVIPGEQTLKQTYLEEAGPLGSVPLPATVKGVAKSLLKTVTGHHPEVFINKLGERLAYERSGVRIYEALIAKCEHAITSGVVEQTIDIARMKEFRDEEAQHFSLLADNIKKLGADPTAQTPDADAIGVAASGLMKVITDPRTSVSQSLEAMLALELADNAAWELLATLAEDMGLPVMAEDFRLALHQEDIHLKTVKLWYEELVRSQVTAL
jgi:hypothetical protein